MSPRPPCSAVPALYTVKSREHEGTDRDTEGVGQDMSMPIKLFLVSGSLFS